MDRDRLSLTTPEGLTLDLPLAGLGSRGLAALLDMAIQASVVFALWLSVLGADSGALPFAIVLVVTAVFVPTYYIVFETRTNGQTPGKMVLRLRVATTEGTPVGVGPSVVRNLLRLVDILPGAYLLGAVGIFVTQQNQRIGDAVAGTVVLVDPPANRQQSTITATPATIALEHDVWDVTAVTTEEVAVLKAFLERRSRLEDAVRSRLARSLADRLRTHVHTGSSNPGHELLIETVVRLKSVGG